jgi:hypothetical protein
VANTHSGNSIHIDTASNLAYDKVNAKLKAVILTTNAAGDVLVLRESATGADKLTIKNPTDESTFHLDLSQSPMVFKDGIYVQTLTSGAKAMLIIEA